MSRSDQEILRDALAHLQLLSTYAANRDVDDQVVIDAMCMRLSAGIEVLARLDAKERDRLFGDDWLVMWGMRNRIAHGYLLVNAAIIRATVTDDLPSIVMVIATELDDEPPGSRHR